jgi:hypothetical protein
MLNGDSESANPHKAKDARDCKGPPPWDLLTDMCVRPLGQEPTWTQRPRTPVENRWSMTIFG